MMEKGRLLIGFFILVVWLHCKKKHQLLFCCFFSSRSMTVCCPQNYGVTTVTPGIIIFCHETTSAYFPDIVSCIQYFSQLIKQNNENPQIKCKYGTDLVWFVV